jgi:senataxin
MNVALTRAKSSLFIFGNGPTLARSDPTWNSIVKDAKERNFFIPVSNTPFATLCLLSLISEY